MKILIANYRYFVSGGPERYMFNVSGALNARGHEIIPFSIRYAQNQPSSYSEYFVEPLGNDYEIYFKDHKRNIPTFIRTIKRLIFDPEVEKKINLLAQNTQPDVAYVLHYLRKLSPSLLVGLKKAGLPIVVRLSDYAMICPQAHFLREGKPCELCLHKGLINSVWYKCVQDNFLISLINFFAFKLQNFLKIFNLIDCFIVTNPFMYTKMIEAGYPNERIRLIPTFVNIREIEGENNKQKGLIVYLGRLEEIKGVHILIEALNILDKNNPEVDFHVKIIGAGSPIYKDFLEKKMRKYNLETKIEFCGELVLSQIHPILSKAQISVVPSIWYENLPNSVLESYACSTAVIASNLGSLGELITENETGYLFEPGNSKDLYEKLHYSLTHYKETILLGEKAHTLAQNEYSQEEHVESLENLFYELIKVKK